MILAIKFFAIVQFVLFYQGGGQGHKWMKKWLGPSLLAALTLLVEFLIHKLGILTAVGSLLYLAAANGFSYGDKYTHDKVGLKIMFRGLCGLSYGVCALLVSLGTGHWVLGTVQLLLATSASILFGVLNPFPASWGNWATRVEDICIALIGYVSLLMWILT